MLLSLPHSAALIIIDVQKGFDDPRRGARNNPQAEANIARLLAYARRSGRRIFHIRHDSTQPTSSLRPGQMGNDFKPEAMPYAGERVIAKTVNSAFIGTALEAELHAVGCHALVLAGLTTNHCVSTTARMAANLGFDTYVVADATATFARHALDGRLRSATEVHEAALSDLHEEFATVIDTDTLLGAVGAA